MFPCSAGTRVAPKKRERAMPHAMRLGQSYSGELIRAKGVRCLYLALGRHLGRIRKCPLSGVKRTWALLCEMSANDQSGHAACASGRSAFGAEADMISDRSSRKRFSYFRFGRLRFGDDVAFPEVCPSRVRRLTVHIADLGARPLAGHIEPSKTTC